MAHLLLLDQNRNVIDPNKNSFNFGGPGQLLWNTGKRADLKVVGSNPVVFLAFFSLHSLPDIASQSSNSLTRSF